MTLTAYTFDLAPLALALIGAAVRGVEVTVFADHGQTYQGTTDAMLERLAQQLKGGVAVLLCNEASG